MDTAVVMLKFDNGIIATIDNSRKAVYGYDQRVEVFGSEGCVRNENDVPNTVVLSDAERTSCENTYKVMWDRYTGAFVSENPGICRCRGERQGDTCNRNGRAVSGTDGSRCHKNL